MAELVFIDDLVWQEVDDGMIVLHVGDGRYFELNAVAAETLRLLHETGSVEATVNRVVEAFEVSRTDAENDVRELIEDFRRRGWLR